MTAATEAAAVPGTAPAADEVATRGTGLDTGSGRDLLRQVHPDERDLEAHRTELTGYCYRLLGSAFDADDAVQDTMVRAWRSLDGFEGRASLRTWLYRIATNVCFDALAGRERRALPLDMSPQPSAPVESSLGAPRPRGTWVEPVPDARVLPAALCGGALASAVDPADVVVARESVRLALVAALQLLPPRQRAVLVLRDVLRWSAQECAELLGTSVPAANSALQRARATLAAERALPRPRGPVDSGQQELLDRYLAAFERYDVTALVALLREDATMSMPPFSLWLRGRRDVAAWLLGPGAACRGSRLVPVALNGSPGFAQYRRSPDGGYAPWSLIVLDVSDGPDGEITRITHFLDTALFARFGLPPVPPER